MKYNSAEFSKRFLLIFKIVIITEDRYGDSKLYKHFVWIELFSPKWRIFSTHWCTGVYLNSSEPVTPSFYTKES